MSKQKIDETMTEARVARAKRKKVDEAMLPPIVPRAKRPKKTAAPAEAKVEEAKPAERKPKEKAPELVVFAFRLTTAERDLIHKAAGAAKASKFVRALMIAASKGDEKTVLEIVRAAKEEIASTS